MNPLLAALVAAGLMLAAEAEVINRQLDSDAAIAYAEQVMVLAFAVGLSGQRDRLVDAVRASEGLLSVAQQNRLWVAENDLLWQSVRGVVLDIASESATVAAIRVGVAETWNLVNEAVIQWAETYYIDPDGATFGSIPNLNLTSRTAFQQAFVEWQRGELQTAGAADGLPQLIRALEPTFGRSRAEVIGITETTRIHAQAIVQAARANKFVTHLRWLTSNDEMVCPICAPLNGTTSDKNGDFGGIGYPPAHVRCILPGNEVLPVGPISAATQSFYRGRCIEITLADGRNLAVTENHPILTGEGWIAAKRLREGDYILSAANTERIATAIDPDNHDRPAAIEQIFSALVESNEVSAVSVPSTTEDFHGDGRDINGNINVVYPNGKLSRDAQASIAQHIGKHDFGNGDVRLGALMTEGNLALEFFGLRLSPLGVVGVREHCGTLVGRSVLPTNKHGIRDIAWRDASFDKTVSEGRPTYTDLGSEFVLRFASDISSDKIVKIRNFDFAHYVYDLQCDMYELYICNGVIVKNCRCRITEETAATVNVPGPRGQEAVFG